jgi:hypothetical protein
MVVLVIEKKAYISRAMKKKKRGKKKKKKKGTCEFKSNL